MLDILGYLSIFIGCIFLLISGVGLLRLPDALTRIHAATKTTTLASILIIFGAICLEPSLWLKLTLLLLFILLTNPLSSSILARSTYYKDGFYSKSNTDMMENR